MTIYESLMLMLTFGLLVLQIVDQNQNNKKK